MSLVKRASWRRALTVVVGMGISFWPGPFLGAERKAPIDPYKGIREDTLRTIALGTPDDLLRLKDALQRTEDEIARLKLGAAQPENQSQLVALRDRQVESEVLLRLLESSAGEIPAAELDRASAQERAALRAKLSGRIEALRESIGVLEHAIRFEQGERIRVLEEERKALGRLLAARREKLLQEYAALSSCQATDRPCLTRKFKALCRLQPLLPLDGRAPILMLQQEVVSQLDLGHGSISTLCDVMRLELAY